ncbi:MAG: hypothetical protein M1813_005481 [Trichoglossum hirsutum]|nr:MAG: hypothetical protein M1813_005481 [Trichoglossum hirsutum]
MDALKISQALSSTFVLGVVSQTIFITFIVYIKDRARTLLRDRRSLILIIFLSFAALGVLFAFIGFFLQSQIGCHVAVILSTISDQAARATILGLLLWTLAATANTRVERFALRGLIGLRIAEGGAFAVFRAPQFAPLCVARSRNLPLAIVAVAFDATIVSLLVGCIYHRGFLDDSKKSRRRNGQPAGFALVLVTFGFFVWSAMSVPSILGASSTTLFSRVAIPSIGLFIFLALIIGASGSFPSTKDSHAISLETPTTARQLGSPQLVGPPVGGREVAQRDLQVAGHTTRREANPRSTLPPTTDGNPMGDRRSGPALNRIGTEDRERNSGSIFRSIIGSPLSGAEIVITGDSRLPVPPKQAPSQKDVSKATRGSSKSPRKIIKTLRSGSVLAPQTKISGPVAISGPIPNFKTVDLAAAAELQRRRQLQQQASRDLNLEAGSMAVTRKAPDPPSSAPVGTLQNGVDTVRKEISPENSSRRPLVRPGVNESVSSLSTSTMSSSIKLKGSDEMRRRSPNNLGTSEGKIEAMMVISSSLDHMELTQHSAGAVPPVPSLTVLYENSTAAKSGLIVNPSLLQSPKAADLVWDIPSPAEFIPLTMSIMDRKRPKVSKETDRTIFPRRESHPLESLRLLTPSTQQHKADSPVNLPQSSSVPTAAAKLEPLIPSGVDNTTGTGIEHRFPAPPSSAPLPLPRFSEFSIPQIPFVSDTTESTNSVATENDSVQSPAGISRVATPLQGRPVNGGEINQSASQQSDRPSPSRSSAQTAIETHRGIHEEEIENLSDLKSIDGEIKRRSITIELAVESDGTLSGGDDDFEMEIPIKLGCDVRPSGTSARSKEWHYRVGDTTPLFSERRRQKGSKAMPPPVPLLLQSAGRHAKVITRAQTELVAERTKDEEMRGQQEAAGLTDRNSDEVSMGRGKTYSGLFRGRGSLLEKIERELDMKEQDWHQLQGDLNRDPLTLDENYDLSSYPSTSPRSTPNQKRLSSSNDKRVSLRIRSLNFPIPNGNPRASTSQTRVQSDYLERDPMRLSRGSMNFLTIDNYRVQASPTPPESERTTSDIDIETDITPDRGEKIPPDTDDSSHCSLLAPPVNARLWRRSFRQRAAPTALLWEAPPTTRKNFSRPAEPPGIPLRPAKRRQEAPLRIYSSQLWTNPEPRRTQQVNLWGQRIDRPAGGTTQRVSQKPQRKSRRFTLLPDIVESPAPIPGKDGVLGIFQGPWGPSDSAWPPMLQLPSLTASREGLSENSPVNSYFFEDFDIASRSGRINDSTIWEIGTLLDDHNIPSRESLFPPMSIMVEDYEAEDDEEEDFDVYDDIYGAEVYTEDGE